MMASEFRRIAVVGFASLLVTATACGSNGSKSGSPNSANAALSSSRGFDASTMTIKVAGIGNTAQLPGAQIGAEARFARANRTHELGNIKIDFVEMANDSGDPATGTSEVRRLVTEDKVFAIVPDMSFVNPGQYLMSQQVPYVGYAFDNTYCSPTPSTTIWGFGFDGCLVNATPDRLPDTFANMYQYDSAKTGKQHPTVAICSSDNQTGQSVAKFQSAAARGAGFEVVFAKGNVPMVVSDYSPYVQQWLTAAAGSPPDVITCELGSQCVAIWQALKNAGYKGVYFQTLGNVDPLAKAMAGTVTATFYNTAPTPALTQMTNDIEAFAPGTPLTGYSNVPAYFAADMFVQAVKKLNRNNITPEALQAALANQTWGISGLVGPTEYPASTAVATPTCNEILLDSPDGSGYQIVEPYTCSSKTFAATSASGS